MSDHFKSLSVVIPAWSGTPEMAEMTLRLAKQVRPMCDELVISEDGLYQKELEEISDVYLLHPRLGHGTNLALGFRASTGEYVALMDSDIVITSGSLRDLCVDGMVVSPKIGDYPLAGWFVVAPRWIINECPPYDRTDNYNEGLDFWAEELINISKDRILLSEAVTYTHGNSGTYSVFRKVGDVQRVANRDTRHRLEDLIAMHRARRHQDLATLQIEKERMPREIMPDRHRQRLEEDPQYRRAWLYTL